TGRLKLSLERFDLAGLSSEVAAQLEVEASRAGSPIVVHAPQPIFGYWDRLSIEQVLTNLLTNAIKFGRGRPIEVSVPSEGAVARLDVRDDGIGIAPHDLARIFGRFERAVSVRAYGGMGIGLFIAREVIEAHGGTIAVASTLGAGST